MKPQSQPATRTLELPTDDSRCAGAIWVVEQLNCSGYEAFLVGGCVRDLLLSRDPKDYDIATSATPEQVQNVFPQTVPVGKAFGVTMVIHRSLSYDVATFRKDIDYSDGRRPENVEFCTVREDVLRRDFTINGLLYRPQTGEVVDYVGGLADLDTQTIRAIGEARRRFEEDHLRVLRALRFAAQLQFEIEPATYAAASDCAPKLVRISRERIRDEFLKMLSLDWFPQSLDILRESGVAAHLLPRWYQRVEASGGWAALSGRFDELRRSEIDLSANLYLAALVFRVGSESKSGDGRWEGLEEDLRELRLSRQDMQWVWEAVAVAHEVSGVAADGLKRHELIRMARRTASMEAFALARAESRAGGALNRDQVQAAFVQRLGLKNEDMHPTPLLTGRDLMDAGLSAGPSLGDTLYRLETAQLDGALETREAALKYALEICNTIDPAD